MTAVRDFGDDAFNWLETPVNAHSWNETCTGISLMVQLMCPDKLNHANLRLKVCNIFATILRLVFAAI